MYYSDKASLNEEYNFLQKTDNCDRLHKPRKKTRLKEIYYKLLQV